MLKTRMKAQIVKAFGPAKKAFTLEEIPIPEVDDHHILIKVAASSVNPVDCKIRSGLYSSVAPAFPAILHGDVAGTVVALGKAVSQFKMGDEVYGCAGGFIGTQGALAEYMLVDPQLMALKPKTLSLVQSASLPLVAITAWLALIDRTKIHAGQTVLVHAASGGVGSIGLQLALWKGAKTYTTASSNEKAAFALSCGATVINHQKISVEAYVKEHTQGHGFDVVFDTVGEDNLAQSIRALKINGTVCAIAACSSIDLRHLHSLGGTLHYIFMPNPIIHLNASAERQHYGEILTKIAHLVDEGIIRPFIDETINFSDIAKAHERLENHKAIGKIVLKQDL